MWRMRSQTTAQARQYATSQLTMAILTLLAHPSHPTRMTLSPTSRALLTSTTVLAHPSHPTSNTSATLLALTFYDRHEPKHQQLLNQTAPDSPFTVKPDCSRISNCITATDCVAHCRNLEESVVDRMHRLRGTLPQFGGERSG